MSSTARLYQNGRFYITPHPQRRREAIAVYGGRIIYAGDKDSARSSFPQGVNPTVYDLEGKTVIAGFVDSHLHLINFGLGMLNVDLTDARSIKDIQTQVRKAAEICSDKEWVVGRGWDQDFLIEGRYPTRRDLDEVSLGRPVHLVRNCGHIGVACSRALEIAGINRNTPNPQGGSIDRDAYGDPTGVIRESAQDLVKSKIPDPSPETIEKMTKQAITHLLSKGITSVHSNDAQSGYDSIQSLYKRVQAQGYPIRVYWDFPYELIDEIAETPLRSGGGDDFFKVGAAKIFADGSLGGRTAALESPYADDRSNSGILVMSQEELRHRVYKAHALGMQTAIHAIGDRAVRIAIEAVDAAQAKLPRKSLRHRIVHAQVLSPLLITEMRRVKVVGDVQPKFLTTDMKWAGDRVGPQRIRSSYAWRTMLTAGIPLAGGSDCPVEPPDPLLGIYAAVTRKNLQGKPDRSFYPNERVSVEDAIRMFTLGGAYAAFEEEHKGTLEPGKLGDFIVLSEDPYRVPTDSLKDIEVLMTVVGGEIAYRKS
jgi:predicted amidohydrolase YtcJ